MLAETNTTKTCTKCLETFPISGFYKNYRNGKPRTRCIDCFNQAADGRKQVRKDPAAFSAYVVRSKRARRRSRRRIVIAGYGNACECCGESQYDFLTIDHVNNNGSEERAAGMTQETLYKHIIESRFPQTYRVLCYNCNCGRARLGVCPHETVRLSLVA